MPALCLRVGQVHLASLDTPRLSNPVLDTTASSRLWRRNRSWISEHLNGRASRLVIRRNVSQQTMRPALASHTEASRHYRASRQSSEEKQKQSKARIEARTAPNSRERAREIEMEMERRPSPGRLALASKEDHDFYLLSSLFRTVCLLDDGSKLTTRTL